MNLTAPHVINDWMSMWAAMAVNEETPLAAGGHRPTNGAAGVVPVIRYWLEHVPAPGTPA